jgi:hypothetical protein
MMGKENKSLLTKFFYRDNYLHFQILVQNANEVQICGEFTNYDEYRKSFDTLQTRLTDFTSKTVAAGKNIQPELSLAKMARFSELVEHN